MLSSFFPQTFLDASQKLLREEADVSAEHGLSGDRLGSPRESGGDGPGASPPGPPCRRRAGQRDRCAVSSDL